MSKNKKRTPEEKMEIVLEALQNDSVAETCRSFDTFENRFVKWIFSELLKKLTIFARRYRQMFAGKYLEEKVLASVETMSKNLDFILKHSFLNDIGDIYKIDSLSLVLQMAPGYREVYKYYLMLIKGLSINGQIFRLSMKQIWELYEYWCFLELNHLLREKYKLLKHNLIDINYSGVYVTLNKSSSSSCFPRARRGHH